MRIVRRARIHYNVLRRHPRLDRRTAAAAGSAGRDFRVVSKNARAKSHRPRGTHPSLTRKRFQTAGFVRISIILLQ